MYQKHVLTIPGRYDEIRRLCDFVSAGAREAGLDEDAVFHVELCCDEAATNIIEHAYGAEDMGDIVVSYESSAVGFTIMLQDNGRSFNPSAVPAPKSHAENTDVLEADEIVDNLQVGGLGIHFMRNLMDEVHFNFGQQGNTLILVKKFPEVTGNA